MKASLVPILIISLGASSLHAENVAVPESAAAKETTVTVSSTDGEEHLPKYATDGDESTRWSSKSTDQEWISLDLGRVKTIAGVDLLWETAYAKEFKIQVSTDGTNWTDAFVQTDGKGDHEMVVFKNKLETRHVRMLGIKRATHYGYSLWEILPFSDVKTITAKPLDEPVVLPDWAIGPFVRPPNPQPVIRPNPDSVFDCPILKKPCHWEKAQTYNPAAVARNGQIVVLYRAQEGPGNTTSRLGYATSSDGITFKTEPKPVFFPDEDSQKSAEWQGGCEDPRLAESPDGTYILTYTQYTGEQSQKAHWQLGLATSSDLKTWVKRGSPFAGTEFEKASHKSAAILHEIKDGHLVAAKVNGKYWMYFGVFSIHVATSEDLIHWVPVVEKNGYLKKVLNPRGRGFERDLVEGGPQPILTDKGIVVLFNASDRAYYASQALFDRNDPTKLLTRLDKPFLKPEFKWEKNGLYPAGTTFIEGLVLFKNQWFVYYGCSDSFVGVAIAPVTKPGAK